jgi:tetratricopeptide (TPR) repeat protein
MNLKHFTVLAISTLISSSSVLADHDGEGYTVVYIRHFNAAVRAFNGGDWDRARNEYRTAIGISPKSVEPYEGLLNTCMHSKEWDQVAYAASKVLELDPSMYDQVAFDYGSALKHLKRYKEAQPYLKRAKKLMNASRREFHLEEHPDGLLRGER